MHVVDVHAEREGQWWVFTLPDLGTSGQARSLAEVPFEAQGVAAMWLNVDPSEVQVIVGYPEESDAIDEWKAAEKADQEARAAQIRAGELRSKAVKKLRSSGYTDADTSRILGISKQRVHQLVKRA